jgi:hypothetical protein
MGEGSRLSHAGTDAAGGRVLKREEGKQTAGAADAIAVIEMIGVRSVKVDDALDQSQT